METLRYIEDKFDSFSLRIKIELFLFPLIILLVMIYFLTIENEKEYEIKEPIKIKNIKMTKKIVDILKDIESYALKNELYLKDISKDNNSIKLEVYSSLKNRISFLNYLENYNNFSKIESLELEGEKLLVQVNFNKLYKKNKDMKNINFDFNEIKKEESFILKAIVGNKALINNKWVCLEEYIEKYKLIKVQKEKIELKNTYKTIVLGLYKNENK